MNILSPPAMVSQEGWKVKEKARSGGKVRCEIQESHHQDLGGRGGSRAQSRAFEAKRLLPHRHQGTACVQPAGGTILGPKGKAVAPKEIQPGGKSPLTLRF